LELLVSGVEVGAADSDEHDLRARHILLRRLVRLQLLEQDVARLALLGQVLHLDRSEELFLEELRVVADPSDVGRITGARRVGVPECHDLDW
jgi:hypothetical protein